MVKEKRNEFPSRASSSSKRTKLMEGRTDKSISGIEEKRTKQTTREELHNSLKERRGGKERESGSKSEVSERSKGTRASSSSEVMKYDTDESPPGMTSDYKHKEVCQSSDDQIIFHLVVMIAQSGRG